MAVSERKYLQKVLQMQPVHNVQIVHYLFLANELGEIDVTCPYCDIRGAETGSLLSSGLIHL